jgi:hypothetical protein
MVGPYTRIKKIFALVTGLAMLYASIQFSRMGFEFESNNQYAWVGLVLALAATCAEMILNSSFRKLNWTVLFIGVCAYVYSVWTNIVGVQSLNGSATPFTIVGIVTGLFLDIYPEVAMAWALEESKIGDLIGNIIKTTQNPGQVTSQDGNGHSQGYQKSQYKAKHRPQHNVGYSQGSFEFGEGEDE